MSRNPLEYAKWYLTEEDYFISSIGNLMVRYPKYNKDDSRLWARVFGFRFYASLPYDTLIRPHDTGKQIEIVLRDIIPIDDWHGR